MPNMSSCNLVWGFFLLTLLLCIKDSICKMLLAHHWKTRTSTVKNMHSPNLVTVTMITWLTIHVSEMDRLHMSLPMLFLDVEPAELLRFQVHPPTPRCLRPSRERQGRSGTRFRTHLLDILIQCGGNWQISITKMATGAKSALKLPDDFIIDDQISLQRNISTLMSFLGRNYC